MKIFRWVILLVVLFLGWYLRTWFHGLVMFFYVRPVIGQVIAITILLHYLVWRRIPALTRGQAVDIEGTQYRLNYTHLVTPLVFVLLLIPGLLFGSWLQGAELARSLEYHAIDELPESDNSIRLMPYEVAARYAKDSLQLSQYKLGTENIALVNDKLQWMFPLTPDGTVITFLRQNKGIVAVDATVMNRNSEHFWQDLVIGEGMQIRDNLYWNLLRHRYFVHLDDPYYLPTPDGEDIYTVAGATSYRWRFRWGILFTVPQFEGVFLTNKTGDIEFLSPEEAQNHYMLEGNRIFPENLARVFVDAHQYHLGIVNRLFIHEDQIQIQDVRNPSSRVNRQPYLMKTEDGLKWFISAEPYGASHGIFKMFLVDAETGRIEVYALPTDETLTGPVRVVDYVRRSNPVVDWSRFNAVEPLPFIRNGTLFWKLTVIPDDAAGIAYQVFVNAADNEVTELTTESDVYAFLEGEMEPSERSPSTLAQDDIVRTIEQKLEEIQELLQQLMPKESPTQP